MVDTAGAMRPMQGLVGGPMSPDDYAAFAAGKPFAPPQSPAWVSGWTRHCNADSAIVLVASASGLRLALPLEVIRRGPVTVARLMGGSHANGNFPPFDGNGTLRAADIAAAVHAARPDIDLVRLERMTDSLDDIASPLAALPRMPSPNLALAANLEGGFEALLDRASGRRKRKKHRSQKRKFEAAGGFRRIKASDVDEVGRLFDAFLAMKHQRFQKMGIADVFAGDAVRAFFRELFVGGLQRGDFMLHGLEVDGTLRAVTGSSVCATRLICEFGAISDDELAATSPGDFLFYENIAEACEQGFKVYDFSVGDEFYKRLWCDLEIEHFDVTVPITIKGRAAAALMAGESGLKRRVKNSALLWPLIKKMRRSAASQDEPADND